MTAGFRIRIRIQPDGLNDGEVCADCGRRTRTVWGYAYAGGNTPHAVYFARWTPGHVERGAQLLVSVGAWGEGTSSEDRSAVGLECRMGADRPSFMVVDAAALPWGDKALLGRMLSLEEALASGAASDAFTVCDALVEQDARFRALWTDVDGG